MNNDCAKDCSCDEDSQTISRQNVIDVSTEAVSSVINLISLSKTLKKDHEALQAILKDFVVWYNATYDQVPASSHPDHPYSVAVRYVLQNS